jgi:hypothetical protein
VSAASCSDCSRPARGPVPADGRVPEHVCRQCAEHCAIAGFAAVALGWAEVRDGRRCDVSAVPAHLADRMSGGQLGTTQITLVLEPVEARELAMALEDRVTELRDQADDLARGDALEELVGWRLIQAGILEPVQRRLADLVWPEATAAPVS